MIQSSASGQSMNIGASNPVAGGVTILSAASTVGSSSSPPPQPAAAAAVTPGGIAIRSATSASPPQPFYNGPAAGQAPPSVVQPQPAVTSPSPAPQVDSVSPVATGSGVIRIGSAATSPQTYSPPQPDSVTLNQRTAVVARPVTSLDQTTATARSQVAAATTAKARLTPGELLSKADLLWICGFILAVVAVAFATMVFEDEVPTTWLLLFVSAASVGVFVKLQL